MNLRTRIINTAILIAIKKNKKKKDFGRKKEKHNKQTKTIFLCQKILKSNYCNFKN